MATNIENLYTMTKLGDAPTLSRKWKTSQTTYKIQVKPLPEEEWQVLLKRIIDSVVEKAKQKAAPESMGRMVATIDGLPHAINDRVAKLEELTGEKLLEKIVNTMNSRRELDISKPWTLSIIYTEV